MHFKIEQQNNNKLVMTKAELVAEVAKKTGIERVAVQATIEEMMSAIKDIGDRLWMII